MSKPATLFSWEGYGATTPEDIARELGTTKPNLYHHINTKSDLLYVICDQAIGQLLNRTREVRGSTTAAVEKLGKPIRAHLSLFPSTGTSPASFWRRRRSSPKNRRPASDR